MLRSFANARSRSRFARVMLPVLVAFTLGGCGMFGSDDPVTPPARIESLRLVDSQTLPGLGAGQGVAVRDGLVYLYGDADPGVIREYRLIWAAPPYLEPTGRSIALTIAGIDTVPHPTGLTFHPEHGTYLGNTVAGVGTIHKIDFEKALARGSLDGCVLRTIADDAAVNGTRPEFVRLAGRWLIATSDYGDTNNQVRLYDPAKLSTARSTAEPGVLVDSYPCGPWVQSLHWIDGAETLVLVQNQVEGLGYRLTTVRLDGPKDLRKARKFDLKQPADELAGFAIVSGQRSILFSASSERNVWFAVVGLRDLAAERRAKEQQQGRRPYNPVTGKR